MSQRTENKFQPVYVVGVGMTKFLRPGTNKLDYPQLVKEAVASALSDCRVSYQTVKQACVGYVYGDSTCGQRSLYEMGMTGIPIYNVNNNCSTGSTALMLAYQMVKGGVNDCVLAVGFEKMERGSLTSKFRDRVSPLDKHMKVLADNHQIIAAPMSAQMFGAAGQEHMMKYGTTKEHFAKIAQKNHKHSVHNQNSQSNREYSLQEILDSPVVYGPLTRLQCCPTSNGAAAAIIVSKKFVEENHLQSQAIEIVGMEMSTDPATSLSKIVASKWLDLT
ncbi:non-specific lipid-transfer protein [Caerostris darwini]|uniref:Non-specific lipid-transfer protein n=1 Tax=Caerostris darwini TaxID=1538125 RepID=A0AAV4PBD8_9ARAC|nr:non-specific lipid-transfer protein [Caerostris darwini]